MVGDEQCGKGQEDPAIEFSLSLVFRWTGSIPNLIEGDRYLDGGGSCNLLMVPEEEEL